MKSSRLTAHETYGSSESRLKTRFLGVEESKETILELIEGYNSSLPAEGKVHHICFKVDSLGMRSKD